MAVLDSNDASTNNAIIPMIGPHDSRMSMAVPNPNDTPTHDAIVSKRSRKKKGRMPAVSVLAAPPRINADVAPPASLNHVHTEIPSKATPKQAPSISISMMSKKPAAVTRTSLTVNEMVVNINNQIVEMGLDLSSLRKLDTTSSDVAHTRTLPLSTVDEHKLEITNDGGQPLDANVQTHSHEKVVHKRSSLVTNIVNRMESMKKGVNNRVVSLSNLTLKSFSLIPTPIRLPPSSSEGLGGSTISNLHTASSSRVDPPGSPAFPEDDPTYRESKCCCVNGN
jgi:hypothetical protein